MSEDDNSIEARLLRLKVHFGGETRQIIEASASEIARLRERVLALRQWRDAVLDVLVTADGVNYDAISGQMAAEDVRGLLRDREMLLSKLDAIAAPAQETDRERR